MKSTLDAKPSDILFPPTNSFIRQREWLEESGTCCCRPSLKLKKMDEILSFLLVNFYGARGNSTWAFLGKQNWRWPRVSVQNASVCTFKTSPVCTGTTRSCWKACARVAGIHGDVLNVHTEAFWVYTRDFQRATHTTHTTHQTTNTHNHTHRHTPHHTDRDREKRQREKRRGIILRKSERKLANKNSKIINLVNFLPRW